MDALWRHVLAVAAAWALVAQPAGAQSARSDKPADTAGLGGRPLQVPVNLAPTESDERGLMNRALPGRTVRLGDWEYTARRNPQPQDSVPWILTARPIGHDADSWRSQATFAPKLLIAGAPVIKVPEQVWPSWFPPDMSDVVGIHYHEFVTNDLARVLMTIHKVPSDPAGGESASRRGTRLEATLLTPLTFSVDQALVVRAARRNEAAVIERIAHERGHAEISLPVLIETLAGPQDWDPDTLTGRRSTLEWYWRSGKVFRRWDTYRGGQHDLATVRTSITLVPPTRWSKLLPIPPERLDPGEIERFNREVVHLAERFFKLDRHAQERFHAGHGAFQQATRP